MSIDIKQSYIHTLLFVVYVTVAAWPCLIDLLGCWCICGVVELLLHIIKPCVYAVVVAERQR